MKRAFLKFAIGLLVNIWWQCLSICVQRDIFQSKLCFPSSHHHYVDSQTQQYDQIVEDQPKKQWSLSLNIGNRKMEKVQNLKVFLLPLIREKPSQRTRQDSSVVFDILNCNSRPSHEITNLVGWRSPVNVPFYGFFQFIPYQILSRKK